MSDQYVPVLLLVSNRRVPDFRYVRVLPFLSLFPTDSPSAVPSAVIDGSFLDHLSSVSFSAVPSLRLCILFVPMSVFIEVTVTVKAVSRASIIILCLPGRSTIGV